MIWTLTVNVCVLAARFLYINLKKLLFGLDYVLGFTYSDSTTVVFYRKALSCLPSRKKKKSTFLEEILEYILIVVLKSTPLRIFSTNLHFG